MRRKNRLSETTRWIRLAAVTAMLPIAVSSFTSQAVAGQEDDCPADHYQSCMACTTPDLACSWKEGETWCHGTQECRDCPTNPQSDATYCVTEPT